MGTVMGTVETTALGWDEIVDAAADALDDSPPFLVQRGAIGREEVSVALAAAMPHIRKQVAMEVHMAICTDPDCPDQSTAAEAVEIILEGFDL